MCKQFAFTNLEGLHGRGEAGWQGNQRTVEAWWEDGQGPGTNDAGAGLAAWYFAFITPFVAVGLSRLAPLSVMKHGRPSTWLKRRRVLPSR